jgi:GNAT superfamily N-acetyltransferase
MRAPGPAPETVTIRRLADPADPALAAFSDLLQVTFADPDTVLELERMQHFLAHSQPDRLFSIIVAEEQGGAVLGGALFSYVPATNCGFSEYLVARRAQHGQGIGRRLFDTRRAILDAQARQAGQTACWGLFIEVDNPRRTPAVLLEQERATAIDAETRLQIFAHLGFWRVDMAYVQPPLGEGKQPVRYLDLLFAPWSEEVRSAGRVPAAWVVGTLGPIWASWAPERVEADLTVLEDHIGPDALRLLAL